MSSIVTKETIKAEVEKVPEDRLGELYEVVKDYSRPRPPVAGRSFMSELRDIKIDGPADFSANIDLYLNGEQDVG